MDVESFTSKLFHLLVVGTWYLLYYIIMRLYYIIQFRPDDKTNRMIYDQLQSVDSGSSTDSASNVSINTSNCYRFT